MLFNTAQFFLFLAVVLVLFYTFPHRWRRVLLLAASYWFYMSWNAKFLLLLLTLTAIDYTAGLWIARSEGRRRKLLLILSLASNLGFLGVFKYYNFLADNLVALLGMAPHSLFLDIVLPLGISFHTFQSMSYVVDVYRREQAAITNPIDYALFIAFFPQLVAGPIVRAREFFGDLFNWKPPSGEEVLRGSLLILLGLTKKMALADQFALISDAYFKNVAGNPGMLTAWSGVFSFAMQIYFDFSGYTDMAIGMAQVLGFHFPVNFRRPYLSVSITDFWRRWHISLSRWLRDYLYISLGGNRHGVYITYRNLMLTMLLGGLWHGASWNFVIWGGFHGGLLCLERALLGSRAASRGSAWLYPLRAMITFILVSIGWVFFRAATLGDSIHVIGQMFSGSPGTLLCQSWHLWLVGITLVVALCEENLEWFERLPTAPAWAYVSAVVVMLLCLEMIGVTDVSIPFVYFQF
ncbi:MAG: MBOAT family protein [Acidobacteriales bacterium]|nr:MBOAT family protein [Terriglobales bacterium]